MKVKVIYDARPIVAQIAEYQCKVKKYLKTGFKLFCTEDDPEKVNKFEEYYGNVIFTDGGGCRGWNTLSWERIF